MIRMFAIFLVLLASVWLGIQLNQDPGYLLISMRQWTIEMTLWVALFLLLFLFCIFHLTLLLITKLSKSPKYWRSWKRSYRTQKAQAITRKGFIEFSEGYWQKAKQHLIQALPYTDTPLLNYLTAARAAQKMGDNQLRDHYLREAQQSMPEAKIAVELTQAELQMANYQWEQALATLRHLQDLAPKHPYVLKLLINLYQEVKDWPQLIKLLPDLKKNKVISESEFEALSLHTYHQELLELCKQQHNEALNHFMDSLPRSLQNHPLLTSEYCRYLIKEGQLDKAEAVLRQALKKDFDDRLINLYGLCKVHDKQISFAESLLRKHPHSAALYLCLGRLTAYNHLWGKAKNYLEKSLELHPTTAAYKELGLLYEQLNDPLKASDLYKKGLLLACK